MTCRLPQGTESSWAAPSGTETCHCLATEPPFPSDPTPERWDKPKPGLLGKECSGNAGGSPRYAAREDLAIAALE